MNKKYRVTGSILGLKVGQIIEANSKDVESSGLFGHSLILAEAEDASSEEPEGVSDDELGSSAGITQENENSDADDAADEQPDGSDDGEPEDEPVQAPSRRKKRR